MGFHHEKMRFHHGQMDVHHKNLCCAESPRFTHKNPPLIDRKHRARSQNIEIVHVIRHRLLQHGHIEVIAAQFAARLLVEPVQLVLVLDAPVRARFHAQFQRLPQLLDVQKEHVGRIDRVAAGQIEVLIAIVGLYAARIAERIVAVDEPNGVAVEMGENGDANLCDNGAGGEKSRGEGVEHYG